MSSRKLGLLITLATIGAAAILIGSRGIREDPGEQAGGVIAVNGAQSGHWIVPGAQAEPANASGSEASDPRKPLAEVVEGPRSKKLATLALGLLPPTFEATKMADYPSVDAAVVTLTSPDGAFAMVAVQQLTAPMPLEQITLGFSSDTLAEWSTGTQYVLVTHAMPQTLQVVIARSSGLMFTVTLGSQPAPGAVAQVISPSNLLDAVRATLDNDVAGSVLAG
jgi:hypothetical protein